MTKDILMWMLGSRKFFVGTLAVWGSTCIVLLGQYKGMPEHSIIALVMCQMGVAWKLIDTIASEDNAQRVIDSTLAKAVFDDPEPETHRTGSDQNTR